MPGRLHICTWALLGCCILWLRPLSAQDNYQLKVVLTDQPTRDLESLAGKLPQQYRDTTQLIAALQRWVLTLHGRSYLEASIDTLARNGRQYLAFVHLGQAYQWAMLRNGNVDPAFLDRIGYRERLYRQSPFAYPEVQRVQEDLLTYAENNGYPFARVYLDEIVIGDGRIQAALMLDKGPFVTFAALEVRGDLQLSLTYLSQYLGIRAGEPYNRRRVLRVRDRLRELPFVRLVSDPGVAFRGEQATVQLNLDRRSASRFDFLIGVLPNSNQSGRLLITGDFLVEMQNQFGWGERIDLSFEQLRPQTQRLNLHVNYPYLLDLPFGIDLGFDLYKRDTTYLDRSLDVGIQYLLPGGNYVKAYSSSYRSSLLTVDTQRVRRTGQLPDTLDIRRNSLGLEYFQQRLDYRYNPRRGWSLLLRAGAGIKRLPRNNLIEQLDIADPYQGLPERSFQSRIELRAAGYIPLFRRSTLKTALAGGYILSGSGVLANEQYRIGGAALLRGFDEEFIFATQYTVFTLEYRLLLGQNAYLYTFGDLARVDDRTLRNAPQELTINYPYGMGAGITFETPAGLFGLSLAFGADRQSTIDLGAPKVHFGYVSLF